MKRRMKSAMAMALSFAMAASVVTATDVEAAKKPKLSNTKVSVKKGTTKTVSIKNATAKKVKSMKWTTKNKKVATVKKSSAIKAKIKGVKKGSTTVTAKFKYSGKKYSLKVKVNVTDAKAPATTTDVPATTNVPGGTATTAPTANAQATATPGASSTGDVKETLNGITGAEVKTSTIYAENFDGDPAEDEKTFGKFTARGPENNNIKLQKANYGFGGNCMLVKDRTAEDTDETSPTYGQVTGRSWSGPQVSLKECGAEYGKSYTVTAWAMSTLTIREPSQPKNDKKRGVVMSKTTILADGSEDSNYNDANIAETEWFSDKYGNKRGTWVKLQATVTMPSEGDLKIYFETPGVSSVTVNKVKQSVDFYIDSFSVAEVVGKVDVTKLPSLQDAYAGLLNLGAAVTAKELANSMTMAQMIKQYRSADNTIASELGGSFTLGNELKPSSLLGSEPTFEDDTYDRSKLPASYKEDKVPKLDFKVVEEALKNAKKYNIKLRGHTLTWYAQTPEWFFKVDYDKDKAYVDKETMTARHEWYIKTVLESLDAMEGGENIYCWDVANECIDDSGSGTRTMGPWAAVYGPGSTTYVKNAFKFARTYARPEVELYYNDYGEYSPAKRDAIIKLLKEVKAEPEVKGKKIIDGMGMQMHIGYTSPDEKEASDRIDSIETAIKMYAEIGKVQITELDMVHRSSETSEQYADCWARLFKMLVKNKDCLDRVVIWGTVDEESWRKEQYPLLFRTGFQPKMAFWEVYNTGMELNGKEKYAYTKDDYYGDKEQIG